ncbi:Gamma-aminobutyric acid (GABA) B receptor [Seminavis robusta]|uniref:Gamma-aminobutyric acid (GABA) B receptor n=1 Tax=Seminavis robusta TaxID=568900 RepID=A0A9N8E136_9STRA|nr:Gamma-aminobutyric acid (GABA) B receptor [Seminavis robusta]|eukprot:Sro541_g163190.1 Gamma-aminobutyric acid (GABA) B receptor (964) ;mRNA; f:30789-33680
MNPTKRQPTLPRNWSVLLILSLSVFQTTVEAVIACENTATCETLLRPGSECIDGVCSNPLAAGCLRNYLGPERFPHRRICSSHDGYYGKQNMEEAELEYSFDPDSAHCDLPAIDYNEIRALLQNWDSTVLTAWIVQILLSEVARVPVSIEGSGWDTVANFYDPLYRLHYSPSSYDYDAMQRAKDENDCRPTVFQNDQERAHRDGMENATGEYQSCAHVMPEAWAGQRSIYRQLENDGLIEPAEGTGGVAKYSWYVPRFVAEKDPTLLSHYGLRGSEARKKLAATFKRPTTWKQYCDEVAPTKCLGPGNNNLTEPIATRPPETEEEEQQYFVPGLYHGHFRATKENDCENYPNSCTGHIANVICDWSTFVVPQAYHNDIAVESNGPEMNGGYPFLRMLEVYQAANYTKSPVLFYWFTPDRMLQSFLGTDAEFQEILLPVPSQKCVDARVSEEGRCSEHILDQVGPPEGACGSEPHTYQKLIVSNLFDDNAALPLAQQSPAYATVKRFRISDLQIASIFDYWYDRGVDEWGYDPRDAVCRWVAENLDELQRFVPRTYPRQVQESNVHGVQSIALAISVFTCVVTVATALAVYIYREKTVMKYAQIEFVQLILTGLFFVCLGAFIGALQPTTGTCITSVWLVQLGYTLELVPLIVKVGAIHRLMAASRRMRRIKLKRWHLIRTVVLVVLAVVVYLLCHTVLDPPMRQKEILLPGTTTTINAANENGDNEQDGYEPLVFHDLEINYYCAPNERFWAMVQMGWQVFLLFMAVALAVQTRHVVSEFNESRRLGIMCYSHFLFLVLRIIVLSLESTVALSRLQAFASLALSGDTFATLVIYFAPMLHSAVWNIRPRHRMSASMINARPPQGSGWFYPAAIAQNIIERVSATSGAVVEAVVGAPAVDMTPSDDDSDPGDHDEHAKVPVAVSCLNDTVEPTDHPESRETRSGSTCTGNENVGDEFSEEQVAT